MAEGELSRSSGPGPRWRYAALGIVVVEFIVLGWIAANAYSINSPIPDKVVGPAGQVVFTGADIIAGQQVFLRYDLMDNGTLWGHYEAGTNLTANHAHGAMMGVFGMLAVAMLVFVLRQMSSQENWNRTQKYVKVSFWGLNIGLGLMLALSLFPTGVLQLWDVIQNGYWHGRSAAFLDSPIMSDLEWARLPADAIFIVFGVVPLVIATVRTYLHSKGKPLAAAPAAQDKETRHAG